MWHIKSPWDSALKWNTDFFLNGPLDSPDFIVQWTPKDNWG